MLFIVPFAVGLKKNALKEGFEIREVGPTCASLRLNLKSSNGYNLADHDGYIFILASSFYSMSSRKETLLWTPGMFQLVYCMAESNFVYFVGEAHLFNVEPVWTVQRKSE